MRNDHGESKIMHRLQTQGRPMCVEELATSTGYAAGSVRKILMRLYRKGRLWRGTGRRYWWGGARCAWWWTKAEAASRGLGQTYDGRLTT